jgi:hypothetical protein
MDNNMEGSLGEKVNKEEPTTPKTKRLYIANTPNKLTELPLFADSGLNENVCNALCIFGIKTYPIFRKENNI